VLPEVSLRKKQNYQTTRDTNACVVYIYNVTYASVHQSRWSHLWCQLVLSR